MVNDATGTPARPATARAAGSGRTGRGLFIALEGPEGGGKTTQLTRLAEALGAAGHAVVSTREPGGTPVGERVRDLLLDPLLNDLLPTSEALLFCAARAQLVQTVVRPALASGAIVVCDRYAHATLAYQGYGAGLPLAELRAVIDFATGSLWPDLTVLLDLPVRHGLERRRRAQDTWNRLDASDESFHERVRAGYRALAKADPQRWRVIDAAAGTDDVAKQVLAAVAPLVDSVALQAY